MESSIQLEGAISSWQLMQESLRLPPAPLYSNANVKQNFTGQGIFKSKLTLEIIDVFEKYPDLRRATSQEIQALGSENLQKVQSSVVQRRLDELSRDVCGYLVKVPNPAARRGYYSKHLYTRNLAYISDWLDERRRTQVLLQAAKERGG